MLLKDVLESHDSVVAVVVDKKENFEKVILKGYIIIELVTFNFFLMI